MNSSLRQLARTCIRFCSALFTNAGALTSFHAFKIDSLYGSGVFAMKDLIHTSSVCASGSGCESGLTSLSFTISITFIAGWMMMVWTSLLSSVWPLLGVCASLHASFFIF